MSRQDARLNLAINQRVRDRIEQMQSEIGLTSMTDVVCRSLALFSWMWEQHKQGIDFVAKDGEEERKCIFFFEQTPEQERIDQ